MLSQSIFSDLNLIATVSISKRYKQKLRLKRVSQSKPQLSPSRQTWLFMHSKVMLKLLCKRDWSKSKITASNATIYYYSILLL